MKQSILWRLTKSNHEDSHILGTMHVKSESAFRRIEEIKQGIAGSEVFAAEYDLNVLAMPEHQEHLLMPERLHIRDLYSEKKYARIRKQLQKSFGINLDSVGRYQPLILVNLLSETAMSKEFKLPLDLHLWNFAKSRSLDTVGIESFQSQVNIIKKIRLKDQRKMLSLIARNPAKFKKNIAKMAIWYREEEILKLYKNGKKSLGKYKWILLNNRNFIMAKRFEELSGEKKTFFAIGAGHLAGHNGVLKILKDNDWKVKAI